MKLIIRITLFLIAALMLVLLTGCGPIVNMGDGLVIGDSYRLASGQTLNHDLTVVGGNVTLEQDSTVNGDVSVVGGNITVDGKISGDLSAIGGSVSLNDHAVIQGQVNSMGGSIDRSSKATVEGQTINRGRSSNPITTLKTPMMQVSVDPITAPLMAIFQALALAALAIVVNLFAAAPMERAGRAAIATPAASGGVGCLTILVLVVMGITIILLPISLLGFLVLAIAALFGWLALGLLIGRQLAVWLKQPWTDPVNAGVGTLVISLLASMLNIIPCIGWMASALLGLVALGAVVLTRFGTQIYPPAYSSASIVQPGAYTPPAYPPADPPASRYYGPESDRPEGPLPSGPKDNNIA